MASRVLVSNGNTNISAANGFLKAEVYNVGMFSTTDTAALSTPFAIPVTFTTGSRKNAGVILALVPSAGSIDRSVYASLQQIMGTCTVNAGTDEVTFTLHGFSDGQGVMITAATTQPGGVTANTIFYARATGSSDPTNTFFLYDTAAHAIAGGATGKVDITSTGSGTLTLYAERGSQTQTIATLTNSVTDKSAEGGWIVPFTWAGYTIDTTASKWRFWIKQTGGTYADWFLRNSTGSSTPFFIEISDIAATFDLTASTNSDCLVAKDIVTINASTTLKAILGTSDTTNGVCAVICKSSSAITPTSCNENLQALSPGGSYTLTIDGMVILGAHSGIRVGQVGSKVSFTNQFIISMINRTVGTTASGIYGPESNLSSHDRKASIYLYGDSPTVQTATLQATANVGAGTIYVNENVSSWQSGWRVFIGKQNVKGGGDATIYTLNGAPTWDGSKSTISLTANIASYNRISGGSVVLLDGYGIKVVGNTTNRPYIFLKGATSVVYDAVQMEEVLTSYNYSQTYSGDNTANIAQWKFSGVGFYSSAQNFINTICHPSSGLLWDKFHLINARIIATANGAAGSGDIIFSNSKILNYGSTMNFAFDRLTVDSCTFDNIGLQMNFSGAKHIITNNTVWGGGYSGGTMFLGNIFGGTYRNNKYDNCAVAIGIYGHPYGIVDTGSSFGSETANTVDILYAAAAIFYPLYTFNTPLTTINAPTTYWQYATSGSYLRIVNEGNVLDKHRSIYPYGYFAGVAPSYNSMLVKQVNPSPGTISFSYNNQTKSVNTFKVYSSINATIADSSFNSGSGSILPTLSIYADGNVTTPVGTYTVPGVSAGSSQTLYYIHTFTTDNNNLIQTISHRAGSSCTEANSGVTYDALKTIYGKYGYVKTSFTTRVNQTIDTIQQTLATLTADPYATLTEAQALTASGKVTINHSTQTATITSDTTLAELYCAAQYDGYLTANFGYSSWLTTLDGSNYSSAYDIVLNTGVDLTGGGTVTMASGKTFTKTGTATYDGIVVNADGTYTVHLKFNNLVAGSNLRVVNANTGLDAYLGNVAGTAVDIILTLSGDVTFNYYIGNREYLLIESSTVVGTGGQTVTVNQIANPIYAQTGVDGATVTEWYFDGATIKTYLDGVTATTVQRGIAWYYNAISSLAYLGVQHGLLVTPDSTWMKLQSYLGTQMQIKNVSGSPITITGGNITDNNNDPSTVIDTTGDPIFVVSARPSANVTDMAGAVWSSNATTPATGSYGEHLSLLKKASMNRTRLVNNQQVVYDDDGTTPLVTWDLKDANGNATTTDAYERDPV